MSTDSSVKTLLKILIGVAWIDGKIQPEEREYLHRIAQEKGIENDPDIQPLLSEFQAVKVEECYTWVREYLGDRPSSETCQQLVEALSGLIYSDGDVAVEEAKLLSDLQSFDPGTAAPQSEGAVLGSIRNLYQRWVSKLG
jgi:uncharacterized tellurite resistance protein B-like protein